MCAQFHGIGTKTLEVNIPEQLTLTVSLRGSREVRDGYQLFRLTGQLDAFSEPAFRRTMLRCIDEGPAHLILDLSTIDFMDSSGLGVLVQVAKKIQGNQGSLRIVTNPRVTQTVKLVRLEQFFSLVTSLEEAQAGLLAPPPVPTNEPNPEPNPESALAAAGVSEPVPDTDRPNSTNTAANTAIAPTAAGSTTATLTPETSPETSPVALNSRPKGNRSKTAKTKNPAGEEPSAAIAPSELPVLPSRGAAKPKTQPVEPEPGEESPEKKPKSRASRKRSTPSQPPV